MKKILWLACLFFYGFVNAQTFPVQNLQVNGTSSFAGASTFAGTATFNNAATFNTGITANGTNFINGYATLTSPAFTGVPSAPTAATGTNSVQLATTAFVANHAPCPSILDHGGDNTNTNDNTAAFAATAAVGPSGQACVYFPPGNYKFLSNVSYTIPNTTGGITVMGAGADQSNLIWASGGGLTLLYKSAFNYSNVSNLSLLTGAVNTGSALTLSNSAVSIPNPANSALSVINNVSIHGVDGYQVTDYWANGVNVVSTSNINMNNLTIAGASVVTGNGINLTGTSNVQAVAINIMNSFFGFLSKGVVYNNWVQGVTVTGSNFTGLNYGVNVTTPAAGQDQLTVSGNQFNTNSAGVFDQAGTTDTMIYGNLFIVESTGSNSSGVDLVATNGFTIVGNTFGRAGSSPTNTFGIIIGGTTPMSGTIQGNVLSGFGLGISLQPGSTGTLAAGNYYSGNTLNLVDNGANFAAFSTGTSGYSWDGFGVLHQWGSSTPTTDASGNFTVALPKTFPTAVFRCMVSNGDSGVTTNAVSVTAATTNTSTLGGKFASFASPTTVRVNWDCLGN